MMNSSRRRSKVALRLLPRPLDPYSGSSPPPAPRLVTVKEEGPKAADGTDRNEGSWGAAPSGAPPSLPLPLWRCVFLFFIGRCCFGAAAAGIGGDAEEETMS